MSFSFITMLFPDAYIVADCIPPLPGGDWRIPHSFFDTSLTGVESSWLSKIFDQYYCFIAISCSSMFVL